ncbi:MAG: hypothetical protein NTX87_19925 [Planctomycetota bacterium]|nr:hypothetical protein [Planctomycetota bacterium]
MYKPLLTLFALLAFAPAANAEAPAPVLKPSDVAFMYAADEAAYKAYGATFVAWGGADKADQVKQHHDLGIRCTGSMWCLTAGAKNLYENADLRSAVARDIEGNPVEVPWLFDHTYKEQKTWFGCTNHPAFREHCRREVRRVMAGGADGLHVDDHLGVAQPATGMGGGLCDYCIAAFREYLKTHAPAEDLAKAGVADLEKFDYRDLIRKFATTRADYMKVRRKVPLMDHFERFHLEAAAAFVRELGQVGAQAAGHPILLSANTGLPDKRHAVVVPNLTHMVCEVNFGAAAGTARIDRALEAFQMARSLARPMACTASGQDYAFIKANGAEDLVRFWIALTYAHGQRFMVPHPKKQWCFTKELGTHWYAAPVEAYAPLYRFIRANAAWFDGFETAEDVKAGTGNGEQGTGKDAPKVIITARRKGAGGPIVLHLVNRDYDAAAKRIRPAKDVTVTLPAALAGKSGRARLLSYDAEPLSVQTRTEGGATQIKVSELRLWTVVVVE